MCKNPHCPICSQFPSAPDIPNDNNDNNDNVNNFCFPPNRPCPPPSRPCPPDRPCPPPCPPPPPPPPPPCPETQTHTHEFLGSVTINGKIPHNHRFAGVTSGEIPYKNSHIHTFYVNTDFFFNHYHEMGTQTGPAIFVGSGKHIHLATGETTENFGHYHDFIFTTLIENPLQRIK